MPRILHRVHGAHTTTPSPSGLPQPQCQCLCQIPPPVASLPQIVPAPAQQPSNLLFDPLCKQRKQQRRLVAQAAATEGNGNAGEPPASLSGNGSTSTAASAASSPVSNTTGLPDDFVIFENFDSVKEFEALQIDEIKDNIQVRRNRIFLLMEEIRRLRIQERLKGGNLTKEQELGDEEFNSALPFLPPLTEKTLNTYYTVYAALCMAVIMFGGLVAPILEVRLGLGGTSYQEFVESVHLPSQLAQVDPIVASFCGGAVGVLSVLLVVEVNNIKKQQKNRCFYCEGTGYLMCGNCVGAGIDPMSRTGCTCCAGTGKVMCVSCLCTGKQMATEHDPRFDPFQ